MNACGHLEVTRFLVESGANLEEKSKSYKTPGPPKHEISNRAHCPSSVHFFLISVISGRTALMWTSAAGHLEVARFLVESGANVQAMDGWYYNTKP